MKTFMKKLQSPPPPPQSAIIIIQDDGIGSKTYNAKFNREKKKKENESIQKPSPMLKKFSYMVIGVHRFCLKLAIKDY